MASGHRDARPLRLDVRTGLARRPARAEPQVRDVHRSPLLRLVTFGRNALFIAGGIAGITVVICPTQQAAKHATNRLEEQFVQSVHAGIARRAGRLRKERMAYAPRRA